MFRQGSLDTLCGVYSVIHAVHDGCAHHGVRLKDADHRLLFRRLCERLGGEADLAAALAGDGLRVQRLRMLLRTGHEWAEAKTGLRFSHRRAFDAEPAPLAALGIVFGPIWTTRGRPR